MMTTRFDFPTYDRFIEDEQGNVRPDLSGPEPTRPAPTMAELLIAQAEAEESDTLEENQESQNAD